MRNIFDDNGMQRVHRYNDSRVEPGFARNLPLFPTKINDRFCICGATNAPDETFICLEVITAELNYTLNLTLRVIKAYTT